ncbi:MAG: hypothetical protein WC055_00355 [Melioribacteraceae bacterium]
MILESSIKRFSGISSDSKPDTDVPSGSEFFELDTGNTFKFHDSSWYPFGISINDGNGFNIGINSPLPTNGDSVYYKDIDLDRCNITGWTGTVLDLFTGVHSGIENTGSSNPKTIIIHFERTIEFGSVTIGSADGGNFSNVKVTVRNPGIIETIVVDESSDSTNLTNKTYNFEDIHRVESLKIEFYTADIVEVTQIFIPKIKTVKIDPNNKSHPIHFIDTDHSGRAAQNSIFGDRIVGWKKTSMAFQFNYGFRTRDFTLTQTNGGTVTSSDSVIILSTSTNVGGVAAAETVDSLRYVPGNEAYAFFTAIFSTPKVNSYQRAGIFDSKNGFFIGYECTDFKITRRINQIDYPQTIDVSKVLPLEAFDPTKGNVYKISFGYLGFATINFEIMNPEGEWNSIGQIEFPNAYTETSIASTNLPMRGEVGNTGNNTDIVVKSGSITAGIIDGGDDDPSARSYTYSRGTATISAGDNMLVAFRNITTFAGRTNRVKAIAQLLTSATEGTKPVRWKIVFNPTFTNTPTWAAINSDSIIEYSTNATITFGTGEIGTEWNMAKADSFFEDVESLGGHMYPGQTAVVVVNSAGSNDTEFSIRWKELF